MLKKLYGANAGHPNIAYPKLTTKAQTGKKAAFVPGGGKVGASDPRSRNKKQVTVAVPHRMREESKWKPIDFVRRKKTKDNINEELGEMRMRNDAYRPPHVRVMGENEKIRMQEKFQYGGGKGLPKEMTHPSGPLPSELRAEAKEQARVAKEWRKRRGEPEPAPNQPAPRPDIKVEMVEHITREIDDRQKFVDSMHKLGQYNENTRRIEQEIQTRKFELGKATTGLS